MLFKKNTNNGFQKVSEPGINNSKDIDSSARIPICLILDTSGSMHGRGIEELNKGVRLFFDFIKKDTTAKNQAEIALITFGPEVKVVFDFSGVSDSIPPTLYADGGTPMTEAVDKALHLIDKKIKRYKDQNFAYHKPWIILMTDGQPNGDITNVANISKTLVNDSKLMFLSIGIGEYADMNILRQFSSKTPPVTMDGLNFDKLFDWIGESIGAISRTKVGGITHLPQINWDKRE
ncbi:MAG: VWA domain-containing protein [Candidatus Thioglobus sp.]|uniref:vWA domain-containing protein n=1 Tax=Candidatus Thioglobus sp. TaxID=2026721 RepID=UPI00262F9CD4|nr:VWA domain-containing protein [Candidatus Thioglobus sp.]MDC9727610.1 VWA domain-containing protein [Candidatus Thioglobus sp.]